VIAVSALVLGLDSDHAIRGTVGVGMHHQTVNNTENGGSGGDAEGERKHRRKGEAGIPAELAQGVTEIFWQLEKLY
jgi:hypothetical protein